MKLDIDFIRSGLTEAVESNTLGIGHISSFISGVTMAVMN
jgi:hypothetical protein